MPTVTETTIDGYASCHDPRCAGYKQESVEVVHTLTEFSYVDLGGDIPGIERGAELVRFADLADVPCPVCGEPRLAADQVRPIYPNISGVAQDALLHAQRTSERMSDLVVEAARRDADMAQMRSLMERQAAALERQERQIADLEGGRARRPRKAPEEE